MAVDGPGSVLFDQLTVPVVNITQPGYIYIWVSNETPGSKVWFDDLTVEFDHNVVSEMTDYYPFACPDVAIAESGARSCASTS